MMIKITKTLPKKMNTSTKLLRTSDLIISVDVNFRNDTEITGLALQTLCNLLSAEPQGERRSVHAIITSVRQNNNNINNNNN